MLLNIRDKAQGLIAKAIIAFMGIGFAFFGIDYIGVGKAPPHAKVNGEDISREAFQQRLAEQKNRLLAYLGENADPSLLDDARLAEPVMEGFIQEVLTRQAADRIGTVASRQLVDRQVLGEPAFQDEGRFSEERYRQALARVGLGSGAYRDALAQEIRNQHLLSGFLLSHFETDTGLRESLRLLRQMRTVRFLTLPGESVPEPVLTDADIQQYYDTNTQDFRSEETVSVEYLLLDKADFYPAIDDAQIQARYDSEVAAYPVRQERQAAHILLDVTAERDEQAARELLQSLRARIEAGETFETLAAEYSQDSGSAAQGGDVGFSDGQVFPEAFEAALASLEPGQVSEPVRTEAGLHLIKLLALRDQSPPSLAESRERIERQLQEEAADPVFTAKMEELANQSYGAGDLAPVAESLGLTLLRSPAFARSAPPPALAQPAVVAAAFDAELLASRSSSALIELPNQRVLVLRAVEHAPATVQPLEAVLPQVRERLAAVRRVEALTAKAEALKAELAAGAEVETVAKQHGYDWQLELDADRFLSRLPADIQERAFALPAPAEGQRSLAVLLREDGDAAVLEVSRVRDGDPDRFPAAEQKELRRFLVGDRSQWLLAAWQKQQRAAAKVRYY